MIAALGWVLLLPLSAYAASRQSSVGAWAAAPIYGIGAVICHQRPERSFAMRGMTWPVCARCTGIYLGAAAVALAALLSGGRWRRHPIASQPLPLILMLGALPSMATLLWEWTTGVMPGNVPRLVAGLPIGAAVIAVIAWAGASAPDPGPRKREVD